MKLNWDLFLKNTKIVQSKLLENYYYFCFLKVTFGRETESGPKLVKRTLFGLMNPYPQKKILTFNKYLSDFEFNVGYGEIDILEPSEIE